MNVKERAFLDGIKAFTHGEPVTVNPFQPEDELRAEWESGYNVARVGLRGMQPHLMARC